MEILTFILLIGVIGFQFYMFKLITNKEETPKEVKKLTKEQRKKQEELRKSFENLMNYDYSQALKKKE